MANSIDQLQIDIVAQDKASQAIDSLTKSIQGLGSALERLDAGKMTSFAKAVDKLSSIGVAANTTSKALKGMANDLAAEFGIRTKKGINEVKDALTELYELSKSQQMYGNTPAVDKSYKESLANLQNVIEKNYQYRIAMDHTTRSVKEYVDATNKAGTKVGMADMMREFGEDFAGMSKVLGSAFKNKLESTKEGVMDLAEYLNEMNSQLGTQFDTDNVEKGFSQLVETVRNAKDVILDYNEAVKEGLVENGASEYALNIPNKINQLVNAQIKSGSADGFGGIISVLNQLGNVQVPDLEPLVQASKNVDAAPMQQAAKAVEEVGAKAGEATDKIAEMGEVFKNFSQQVWGNEVIDTGFTMTDIPDAKGVEYPPAIIAEEIQGKLLPAVNDARTEMESFYSVMNGSNVDKVYEAYFQKFSDWKMGELATEAERCLPAIVNIGSTAMVTVEHFKTLEDVAGHAFKALENQEGLQNALQQASAGAETVKSAIEQAIEKAREYQKVVSEMQSGKMPFDKDKFDEAVKGYQEATDAIKKYKDELLGVEEKAPKGGLTGKVETKDTLASLVELGEAFENLSRKLDGVAEKLIGVFKKIVSPLRHAVGEYTEKFAEMADSAKKFAAKVQAHVTKLAAFWKRAMRTFTFILVRKAITAVIKEVGSAVQSMALFSNMMGTMFNSSISNLVADFQYLGRSIVSVFAPLINIIAPIIDAIVSRIATLLSYIGMLIAALGGQASFTKAKKNVENYAESLDDANKSAKNLTMGIDELNILSENSGGSSKPYDGWEDAWEEVDIPDWIKDIADWLKDFWKRFFAPLLEAWNRAKQYLIDGFKTMLDSLKRLFGHIIDDFLTMWNQEKTIHMFEQILRIVGDLMRVVRNLADQFDKAWQKGKIGLKIFENLRDIMAILVEHARNVSYYMIGWAKNIDFSPLLESFELLTRKMKPLADFIGGIFEDAMKLGVLKYIQFLIEKGIPEVQETFASILDTFSFHALREKLKPLWEAFEEMLEQIHEGSTKALGNLGREIARFTNSKDFTDFLQRIADITKLVTAERVEKLLTGIGKGILAIAKAIVKFVNSKPFMKFLEAIAKWIDNSSVDQIASVLTKIANAIVLFKFGAFAAEKLSGFFKFFAVLTAMKNITSIVSELNLIGKALGVSAEGAEALGGSVSKLAGVGTVLATVAKGAGAVFVAFEEFKHYSSAVEDIVYAFNGGDASLDGALKELIVTVGLASAAFTLLLGFPAGIIAAGCVAAVAAIKGIADAVTQIRMDHIFDTVLSQGDTTIQQVKDWYNEATEVIDSNISRWKDAERNLTQDRGDLEAYGRTIQELGEVFLNTGQITSSMADTLSQKYKDLGSAIENYINQSTDALVSNLLAQKAFLEAQGMDVDQMIIDIYRGAEEEKKAVSDSVEAVSEAVKGLDGLTEGTQAYNDQMEVLKNATIAANEELKEYYDIIGDVDTSEAVREIEKLGKSLNLSQYDGDWNAAATDIKNHIEDVKAAYLEKSGELKDEAERMKEEIDLMPNVSDEVKEAAKLSIDHAYDEASAELSAKTAEVFTFYADALKTQMEGVATQAHSDWETLNPLKKLWYGSEDKYILTQMQVYVDNMLGQEGLAGAFSEGFAALPGVVDPKVVESMTAIVDSQQRAYEESMFNSEAELKGAQVDTFTNVLNSVDELDFDSPASLYTQKNFSAYQNAMMGVDYRSLGVLWNQETGGAILNNSQIFEDSNRLAANEGAAAFSQEYVDFLSDNSSVVSSLEEVGSTYGKGIVEGLNSKIDELSTTTEKPVNDWFNSINNFIHNNPFLPFGSPNKKTQEYGEDMVTGFNLGITMNQSRSRSPIQSWFSVINDTIKQCLTTVQSTITTFWSTAFNGSGVDVTGSIATLFAGVTQAILDNFAILGNQLLTVTIPEFFLLYIQPFAMLEKWQPLFDMLLNQTFIPMFELFRTWFMDDAMTPWWEEDLLSWFEEDLWDEDIFDPLGEHIQEHWDNFIDWWDNSMTDWWNGKVVPWFVKSKWVEQFNHILEAAKQVFDQIREAIKERINQAKEAVVQACEEMKSALSEVLALIEEVMSAIAAMDVSVNVSGGSPAQFATGGFPAYGSLFVAGEPGASAEWVGNINGRTGVVSNGEITGIADAVYATGNTESELLSQLLSINRQILDKEVVVIGDKDIARLSVRGQSKLGMSIIT